MMASQNFNDFKVTKRELLACITIISIMFLLGCVLAGKLETFQIEKNAEYYKAAQVTESGLFQYGMDTSIGNAFVQGDLEAVDTVTFPEIDGNYIYVEKAEQHYNRHEREVQKKDKDGNTYTEIEVYYSWDTEKIDSLHADQIKFLGIVFPYEKIKLPSPDYITTLKGDSVWDWWSGEFVKVRYQYRGCSGPYNGTIYTDLRNGNISDSTSFYMDCSIDHTIDQLTSGFGLVLFWLFWILLTGGLVFAFVYYENDWLEDKNG